ncbi:MAG TPA: MarR family transcriptional regulator [Candidatus Limnocylindrales bacterium]
MLTDLLERLVVVGVAMTTRALAEATPGLDLTLSQWRVLLILGDADEGATVSEVASRVGVTLPATSRQLRRLARRGLVAIAPDERDRRAARARLTAEGTVVRDTILSYRRQRIAEVADGLELAASTTRDLATIVDAYDRYR